MCEMKKKDLQVVDFDIDGYFVKPTTDTLVYLMNSLEEPDKQKIKEMAERTRIKEKYKKGGKSNDQFAAGSKAAVYFRKDII